MTRKSSRIPVSFSAPPAKKNLLKGGGLLAACLSSASAWPARILLAWPAAAAFAADTAGPPDPRTVDSWIAIHADNTATIYFGKIEMGQGNTTGMLQIAGEELDLEMSQMTAVKGDTNITPDQGATSSSSSIERGGPQLRTHYAAAAEAQPTHFAGARRQAAPAPRSQA